MLRRAVSSLITAAAIAAAFVAVPTAPAAAQECEGMGCAHQNYERTRHSPGYGSRYDGYWDRAGERRGHWSRHHHHHDDRGPAVHYYPGYGYYSSRGAYYDDRYGHGDRYERGPERDAWCARRYRTYDPRSGTYAGYDGRRHHCG
ncbi:MAG: BA14K family protein [Caulobacteraceae bacterium]|nr:BA14K family protein [Caulobacteraceae bacterium]